jgi:hypothetical protein
LGIIYLGNQIISTGYLSKLRNLVLWDEFYPRLSGLDYRNFYDRAAAPNAVNPT